ncbi:hypothetical protein HPB50_015253 [Hyalomma asiaticum]|uniref:Uncharacterized protein n=1 Tax=Hyalomma asiaticum TaxID=266040 RepID=A0ACB7RUG2_HYAAI|nr:hypothetical protein HPB50_015253 [Hyalomma asiaticum]
MTAVPSFLLGADPLWKFMTGEIRRGSGNIDLVSLGSSIGRMFQGPLFFSTTVNMATQLSVLRVNASNETTDAVLRKFWDPESTGIMTEDGIVPKLGASFLEEFQRKLAFATVATRLPSRGKKTGEPLIVIEQKL